ncbi:hypothetical protein [Sphingomicrobium aestuariivivum]|uniref:hypothetical protein n=1 Tax=Sphingomicrobium aestuariivivum TaxID=1582356 RepID=UPI001FD6BA91|nr:hypothetical protein [Sphingomicrobium aestuariivivum]MCJ8190359.1 hypothetical protein [Sphingomicrobium aestuariivivum]
MFSSLALAAALLTAQTDDYRAEWHREGELAIVLEISESGDVRGTDAEAGEQFYAKDGRLYLWTKGEDGHALVDFELLNQLMLEQLGPWLEEMADGVTMPVIEIEAVGPARVGRWEGTAYHTRPAMDDEALVVSTDPELAPLGKALRESFLVAQLSSPLPGAQEAMAPLVALFGTGTPLRLDGTELTTFETVDLPDTHFDLPATPLTLEETRDWMKKQGM